MRWKVEVSGWDIRGEYVTEDGYGKTEEAAVQDAVKRASITEIGDVHVLARPKKTR